MKPTFDDMMAELSGLSLEAVEALRNAYSAQDRKIEALMRDAALSAPLYSRRELESQLAAAKERERKLIEALRGIMDHGLFHDRECLSASLLYRVDAARDALDECHDRG